MSEIPGDQIPPSILKSGESEIAGGEYVKYRTGLDSGDANLLRLAGALQNQELKASFPDTCRGGEKI